MQRKNRRRLTNAISDARVQAEVCVIGGGGGGFCKGGSNLGVLINSLSRRIWRTHFFIFYFYFGCRKAEEEASAD